MKILVTGGLGFIGSHLVDRYVDLGYEVIILDNLSTGTLANLNPNARFVSMSLLDKEVADLVYGEKPDIINHQAAQVNVRNSVANPLYDLETNLQGTVRLLEAAGKAEVKRFIFSSSGGTVYGKTPSRAIPESYKTIPISPYGINKLASEFYIRFYAELYGFQAVILRYSNVYGLRQNPLSESGVISIFINRLQNQLQPIIYGDGEQIRDYIHVSDVVNANIMFSQLDSTLQGTFNVGTGKGTSLNKLLTFFYEFYPYGIDPVYKKAKEGDLFYNVLSIDKLASLGWSPKLSLEEGIKELCQGDI
ncbi:NAD-dependent epimerase/dehydratase family protein [Cytobacillus firmus]|uniref:NAD-dependent epimerase/dehydratase family protein n=1 Tax=Cytobacillus firmus TaxID=1399 RepID=UPI0022282F4E|nr:NAD-dependent epimerase/dehydratase family protein [Cytobacillus firmus]